MRVSLIGLPDSRRVGGCGVNATWGETEDERTKGKG